MVLAWVITAMNSLPGETNIVRKMDLFNYYGDFLLLPLILLGDFYFILDYYSFDLSVLVCFIAGILFYGSIMEYGFHRYVYHGKIKKINKLHLIHHKLPKAYISSPPYVTAIIMFILHLLFINLMGYKLGCAFVGGIAFGYLWYITIHHLIHHVSYEGSKVLNYFKIEHQQHHNHAKLNYCVSQPFWNTIYRKLDK